VGQARCEEDGSDALNRDYFSLMSPSHARPRSAQRRPACCTDKNVQAAFRPVEPAYAPVDADDPDDRARLVFEEAAVAAVVGNDLVVMPRGREAAPRGLEAPGPLDDAWIIFTSGSTGTLKGVAVSQRSAAVFVDAESRMFLQQEPLGARDRVMAALPVAFDASCEEIWLAWAHGACLVPAPRSLVRSGVEASPWLVANAITVVSTVPTFVSLWPDESLAAVRLLVLGGRRALPTSEPAGAVMWPTRPAVSGPWTRPARAARATWTARSGTHQVLEAVGTWPRAR